ncbi:MAG: molybdopterin-dependent oxidoreductase [Albidovulum sp.]|nr:molybdopterin-dependent oxidoreductase [Albidovulum sp.]
MSMGRRHVSEWMGIENGMLVVRPGKVDIGQRISTALAEIAREELTVLRDRIRVAKVKTGSSPDEGTTSGSNSLEQGGLAIRRAAATLRRHAIGLAAEQTGSRPNDWTLTGGILHGPGRNRPVDFLEFAEDMDLRIPLDQDIPPPPARARPASPPMLGIESMAAGSYRFLQDFELPGMLHARAVRPPHARARLIDIRQAVIDELADGGIITVRYGSFIAVAGPREWPVVKAARRVLTSCTWDLEKGLPEIDVDELLAQSKAERMPVLDGRPIPDAPIAPMQPRADCAARYLRPFTMHASLGPSAGLAIRDGKRISIISHSQGIYALRASIAECLGLELENVEITFAPGSGCYGHNGADDAAFDATLVANAIPGKPILLKWTRENEHCWEPFGPPQAVELAAWLGEDGRIEGLSAEAIGGTYRGRPSPGPGGAGPARLLANRFRGSPIPAPPAVPNLNKQGGIHRNLDPCYEISETRLVKNLVPDLPHRTSALRCLGAAANIFAIESFMDELAFKLGKDPLSFRRSYLEDPRALAVLDRLGEAMERAARKLNSDGRGIAYAQYKNEMARVAVGVFVSVADDAAVTLDRAIIVVDAGRIVDLPGLEAQMEGGFLQGASWALHEEVVWNREGIVSSDWDSYPVLRFDNVPEIETIAIDRPDRSSNGAGEASGGPAIAAIVNAVFDATGLRIRRLPLTAEAIRNSALDQEAADG